MRLLPLECWPTVAASHNEKSVMVVHEAYFRFLLPHEHALLQLRVGSPTSLIGPRPVLQKDRCNWDLGRQEDPCPSCEELDLGCAAFVPRTIL